MAKQEMIQIYDENMKPIGTTDRETAHTRGDWHCCCHYWLTTTIANRKYIIFSKRSKDKSVFPNLLCPSASGHVSYGETAKTCSELKQEMGISIPFEKLTKLGIHAHTERNNETNRINNEFIYTFMAEIPNLEMLSFKDGEVSAIVVLTIPDSLDLFSRKKTHVSGLQYEPKNPGLVQVDISLKDFVPDAVTVDSHYYKVALATDILANCRDAAAKRCMIDIPITIPPLSHINPYIDAETRWTEGLKKAREASAFADSCMAKEEASPFDYSCPDYVIKAENNAWLAISDIPRDRLTKSEIAYVDTLIKQNQ